MSLHTCVCDGWERGEAPNGGIIRKHIEIEWEIQDVRDEQIE